MGGWGEEELGLEVSEKKQSVIRGLKGAACQGLGKHSTGPGRVGGGLGWVSLVLAHH